MHLRSLIELALLASAHSPLLIERRTPLPREALSRMWCASRVRARVWRRRLDLLVEEAEALGSRRGRAKLG